MHSGQGGRMDGPVGGCGNGGGGGRREPRSREQGRQKGKCCTGAAFLWWEKPRIPFPSHRHLPSPLWPAFTHTLVSVASPTPSWAEGGSWHSVKGVGACPPAPQVALLTTPQGRDEVARGFGTPNSHVSHRPLERTLPLSQTTCRGSSQVLVLLELWTYRTGWRPALPHPTPQFWP